MYAIRVNNQDLLHDYYNDSKEIILTFSTKKKAVEEVNHIRKRYKDLLLEVVEVEEIHDIDLSNATMKQIIKEKK